MLNFTNLINGQLLAPASGKRLDVYEPATGSIYAHVPDSGDDDVAAAVAAAQAAFPAWQATSAETRARWLNKLADAIEADFDAFVAAESKNTGKPMALAAQVDIPRAIANLRFFAGAATQFASEAHLMEQKAINYTIRQALGPVAVISPWNMPLHILTWKIGPALSVGNTVIAKPSEVTPHTAWLLAQASIAVGFPPGVLNIIHGSGATTGTSLINHPKIKAISFTGSTKIGQHIAASAAPQFKKFSLELGGKNPYIVFADADLERASETALQAAFSNQGQICLCGSRILVQRAVYEQFKNLFVAKAAALKPSDPSDQNSKMGALTSKAHYEKVMSYLELAKSEGGKILTGGSAVKLDGRCQNGWFIAPTVIEDLPADCRTNTEEIFGPVTALLPFDDEQEALAIANSVPYGLAASVWTTNLDTAHRMAAKLESGIVWVNCWMLRDLRTPFGGMKQSGMGREGGQEALRFFTEPRNVCIAIDAHG